MRLGELLEANLYRTEQNRIFIYSFLTKYNRLVHYKYYVHGHILFLVKLGNSRSFAWLIDGGFVFFFCSLDRKWILNLNCFIWLFFQQDHMAYLVANIGGFLICRLFLLVLIFCWSDQFLHPYGYLFLFMPFDLFFSFWWGCGFMFCIDVACLLAV